MSTSFTSEITRILHDPSYFCFFRFSFDGALHLFSTVNTEAEVDSFPCWSRVVQSQWQKLQRSPLHNSCSDILECQGAARLFKKLSYKEVLSPATAVQFSFRYHIREFYAPSRLRCSNSPDLTHPPPGHIPHCVL